MPDGEGLVAPAETGSEAVEGGVRPKLFTSAELRKLNQRHNAHVAVRGKVKLVILGWRCYCYSVSNWLACAFQVYDVSSFLSRHPGGAEQLMLGAGRDVTQLFESYHPFKVYE